MQRLKYGLIMLRNRKSYDLIPLSLPDKIILGIEFRNDIYLKCLNYFTKPVLTTTALRFPNYAVDNLSKPDFILTEELLLIFQRTSFSFYPTKSIDDRLLKFLKELIIP